VCPLLLHSSVPYGVVLYMQYLVPSLLFVPLSLQPFSERMAVHTIFRSIRKV
jgi:hypothetical protein